MDRSAQVEIESACNATTQRFFHCLDTHDDPAAVALFDADGIWERQGKRLQGHVAVLAALAARSAERATCHVITNVVTTVQDASTARVDFCLSTYEGQQGDDTAPIGRLASIRRCVDSMVRVGDDWRIAHKSTEQLFRGA